MNYTTMFIRLLLALIISITMACTPKSSDCRNPNNVTLQFNWTDDPTFTGEYVAKERFWMKEKLYVTLQLGGVGIDPIAMVVSKKVDYAVVGADKALIAISNGAPIRIVSVDLQRNPVGWIVRQELKILTFDDLAGKSNITLGDKSGTEVSAILQLILKRRNLNIKPKAVSFDFSYFIANNDVVYPVYLNEEPFRATYINKLRIAEIDPALDENGGIKLYGNVIVSHKDRVDQCPDQVRKLVEGIKFGWQFYKTNREETLAIVSKYVKLEPTYLQKSVERTVEYATTMYGRSVPAGHMEYTAWENTVRTLKEAGLITKDIDLNQAIYLR